MQRLCTVHVYAHCMWHVCSDEFPLFSVDYCPLIDILITIRRASTDREGGGDEGGGGEDTLTPPTTSSPGSAEGGVTSASSVVWAKSGLHTGSGLRQVSQISTITYMYMYMYLYMYMYVLLHDT